MKMKRVKLFIAASMFVLLAGCMDVPKDFVAPQWDTNLNLPLINKTYTLNDIIKPQNHITVDTSGGDIYLLQSDKYYLNNNLSEFVKISEESLSSIPILTSDSDSLITYLQFPGGTEVESAKFDEGTVNVKVSNPSSSDVTVTIIAPGLKDINGNTVVIYDYVSAGHTNTVSKDIKDCTYEVPPDQSPDLKNSLRIIFCAISPQQGKEIYSDISLSEISFQYLKGKILSKSLGDQTSSYLFNVEEVEQYRDKTFLKDAKLNLNAYYVSMYDSPVDLEIKNLNVIAKRNDGSVFYLRDSVGNPNFDIRIINGVSENIFTENNSNINNFVTYFPDSVILNAEYIVNPENSDGTYSNLDSIKIETDFSTRSYLAIKQTTINEQSSLEISQSDRDEIENGQGANVNFVIDNGIPLTAWLKIDVMDKYNNYLFTLTENPQEGDSISFIGADVDQNGEVTTSYLNTAKSISLNNSQIRLLSKAYFINYSVSFRTKDAYLNPPQIVAVRPSDWIKLKAYGTIKYRVNSK